MSSFSSLGIGSGLDLNTILDGFMQIEAVQQNKLKTRVTTQQSKVGLYQALNTKFAAVKTASEALNLSASWRLNKAASSDASVTASATGAAIPGSFSFTVQNLAKAHVMASSGTVPSLDTIVGSGRFFIGSGSSMGFSSLTPSNDLAPGNHTLAVTQATAAAEIDGATPAAASTTITSDPLGPPNNTFSLDVNGAPRTFTLADGTYDRTQLVAEINRVAGADITASLESDNSIKFASKFEGSAATLQVTGGDALADIGHSAGGVATGTNGLVTLDGVQSTVTDTRSGATFASTTGSVTAALPLTGLTVGTTSLDMVDSGDGKLSTIVGNINRANGSMTAAAIQVSPGQYKLQLQSKETGVANGLTLDPSSFSGGGLGALSTVTAALDATLQVGSGAGAYTVTSPKNTVTDVLPGVTMTLNSADPLKTVNVTVGADGSGMAGKVKALVDSANEALKFIRDNSKYDPKTSTAGGLLGNSTAQRLQSQLFRAISDTVAGADLKTASAVGIKSSSDGTFTFDQAKFEAAYAADPHKVASIFLEGGTNGSSTLTQPGLAERLVAIARGATDSVSGSIQTSIKGMNKSIDDLQQQISRWDDRLATRRTNLKRQFTALDVAMAQFQSQGQWLSGQISGLQGQRSR